MSWRAPAKNLNDKDGGARPFNTYNKAEGRGTYQQGQQTGSDGAVAGGYKSNWGKPRWQDNNPDGQHRRDENRQQSHEWRNNKHRADDQNSSSRPPKADYQQSQGATTTAGNPPAAAPASATPAPVANSTIRAPTGEVWTKVKNPFNKGDEN